MSVRPPRPRLPSLNGLRAFEAAARLESFAKAADELGVTPGAITQQVRQFEAWLGFTVFRRLPQGVALTEAAREALPRLTRGFDMLVTFELDSADLLPEAKRNLETVAAALNDDRLKVAKFKVEGHTDAFGTDEYNLRLSEERAKAVTDFLVQQNVERERILAVGLGKASPRTDDPYDPGNRRVELNLSLE